MSALTVIVALAALAWGLVLVKHLGLVSGGMLLLAVGCCFGHPFFHVSAGPLPLTADRLLLALLVALYAFHRRWGLADPKPLTRADVVLLALLATLAFSTFAGDWRVDSHQPVAHLLFLYLMPAVAYWLVRQAPAVDTKLLGVFAFLAALGGYMALVGLAEQRQLWWLVVPSYIRSPEHLEFLGRARGPLLNPIGCGLYLSAALAATLLLWPHVGRLARAGLVAASLLLLAAVHATLTRSVWIGAALALMVLLACALPRRVSVLAVTTALCAAAVFGSLHWDRLNSFKRDHHVSEREMATSAELRPILATVAWRMFQDRPLLGCGFGQYREQAVYYLGDRNTPRALERSRPYIQHNMLLSLLTETGLVGAGLFTLLLALWGQGAWRLWSHRRLPLPARQLGLLQLAVIAAYLPNAMFHEMSHIPMVNMLLFTLAGLVQAAGARLEAPAVKREASAGVGPLNGQLAPSGAR